MHKIAKMLRVNVIILGLLVAHSLPAHNLETIAEVDKILKDWRTVDPSLLQSAGNADVLATLKRLAIEEKAYGARVVLIRLNDAETIDACVQELHGSQLGQRATAGSCLGDSNNPAVIPLLATDLFKEENTKKLLIGDFSSINPPSVGAANIIRRIVTSCPAFTSGVRSWAKDYPSSNEGIRASTRAWWTLNEVALKAGNYQAVVVPPKP